MKLTFATKADAIVAGGILATHQFNDGDLHTENYVLGFNPTESTGGVYSNSVPKIVKMSFKEVNDYKTIEVGNCFLVSWLNYFSSSQLF